MVERSQESRLDRNVIDAILERLNIDTHSASIREMVAVVMEAEKRLSTRFLRMEMGIPGLRPHPAAVEAEIDALENPEIPATYATIGGIPALKEEGSLFFKNFLNVDIPSACVIPTVGAMQGGFLSQAVAGRRYPQKDTILYVDPCFSVHRMQTRFLGLRETSVDLYDRTKMFDRMEALCAEGNIGAILYSSPNNPTWVVLTEEEMKRLGEICTKYDVVAIEDSAYFGMDFRRDYSVSGQPPYPPTVARYTDNYVILVSASKIFSYAGQRISLTAISPGLAKKEFPGLKAYFGFTGFHDAYLMSALYCTTSSVPQSPQYALAAMLKLVNRGEYDFLAGVAEYAERAKTLRKIMLKNGFRLVYDHDLGDPLSDGFYFTFSYPGLSGGELVRKLLYYGISATTLAIAGSSRLEAVRACVSMIGKSDYELFKARIQAFHKDHPIQLDAHARPVLTKAVKTHAEPLPELAPEEPAPSRTRPTATGT